MVTKLQQWCLAEAKRDIQFAKEKLNDREWMKMASEMSKEMVFKNSRMTPKQLAKEICDYLKMRACARENRRDWIDPSARDKIKGITGRYPRCRVAPSESQTHEFEVELEKTGPSGRYTEQPDDYGFWPNPPIVVRAKSEEAARKQISLPTRVKITKIRRVD